MRVGGNPTTVKLADAVFPVPRFDVTAFVVLFLMPAVVPMTFTLNVQDTPAASAAPVKLTVPVPAVAVIEPPPHDPVRLLGVATTTPAGRLSVTPTLLNNVPAFGLVMVKLRLVLPFSGTVAAPNTLLIVGGTPPEG